MATLSIIIPTHRRADILAECLRRIEKQTVADQLEVIVVSDGHDEETRLKVESGKWKVPVMFFEIPKSQQGVARNEGVKHATAPRVLFIGDDIFLEPESCEKHLSPTPNPGSEGGGEPAAVLGFTTWDPACGITPVMRWLEQSGWQFGYPMITKYAHQQIPADIQHRFTYTSHISLPTDIAKKFPFLTDARMYGWEDTEWGMRLALAKVPLVYEPGAKALHHHHIELADSLRRMEVLGQSAVEIRKIVPGFDRVPTGLKLFAYKILALMPTMAGRHRKAFLGGILSGY